MRNRNMNNFFIKLAEEPIPPGGMGQVIPAEPPPQNPQKDPPPKGSGVGGKGAINLARNWREYISMGSPRDQIQKKWYQIIRSANENYSEDNNSYDYDYDSYRTWWKNNGANLDPAGVIAKFDAIIKGQATAGGTGTDANDAALSSYLTKLLPPNLTNRSELFRNITTTFSNAGQPNPILSGTGGKQYVDPEKVAYILGIPGYMPVIKAAYEKDAKDPSFAQTLYLAQDGVPGSSIGSATTSPSAANTGGPQGLPREGFSEKIQVGGQTLDIVSLGTWGGDQIYINKASLDTDTPTLYIKDNRTGRLTVMGPDQVGRKRQYLGPLESSKAKRALMNSGVREAKAEAFLRYMKAVRKDTKGQGFFSTEKGRDRRKGERQKALDELKQARSSTRQSRLDNLRKKGVI